MKKLFLTLCTVAALGTSAFAGDSERIEIGAFTTISGVRVSCVYHIQRGHNTEAHLIFPDGRDFPVYIEAGTSVQAMDKALQEIANEQ